MFYTFEKARPFRISFESITTNQDARIRHFILKNQMLTGSPILPVKDKFRQRFPPRYLSNILKKLGVHDSVVESLNPGGFERGSRLEV